MRTCHPGEPVRFIQYLLYPLLFLAMIGYATFELGRPAGEFGRLYGYYLTGMIAVMILVEAIHPLRREWKMTRATFLRRDLPFLVIGGITVAAVNYLVGVALLHFGGPGGSHGLPLFPSVVLALLIPDFFWYWIHRWSHEARGPVGRWLWRMHVAHHLPQQVYLFMHGVAHPINTVIVQIILRVPLLLLGFSAESLFIANLVVGLQGLVSHFNVGIRAGWFNYLLMGTELHRYHHSADPAESLNYAGTVTLWDQLFGTLVYRPGVHPKQLGVIDPERYPQDQELLKVLAWPFVPEARQPVGTEGGQLPG